MHVIARFTFALIPGGPYYTNDQKDALARIGHSLLAGDHYGKLSVALLLASPPPKSRTV